jgi:hypothetical protein
LSEVARLLKPEGALIFFDDLDLDTDENLRLEPGSYFHAIRFGRALLREFRKAGLLARVIPEMKRAKFISVERDFPFVIGSRTASGLGSALAMWLDGADS